ncbi:MAG: site-2 protease family protein [Acidobacteria bacterium]|nr:MAG: site-2 protease family protein [Acidobacteriota bacterium]
MRWSWKIAEIAGIGIYIHATFWLLLLFILYQYWSPRHSLADAIGGASFVMAVFGCIILHELGHALTARRFGIRTRDITLLPIGGLARLERMPDQPKQELWVALAGPAVNVVIAGALWLVLAGLGLRASWGSFDLVGGNFLNRLMVVNAWLVLFNLIPAFPMDGGRVLRALLATRLEYTQATQLAARVGQAIAFFFGLLGLFTDPFLVFIALFVWLGAEQEAAMVQMHTSLGGIPVQRVMMTEFHTLSPDDPLSHVVDLTMAGSQQDFPVVFGDHVLGVLARGDLVRGLAEHGQTGLVRNAMNRDMPTADSYDMLEKALASLHGANSRIIPVLHDGRLVGLLTMDNIGEFMMIQAALRRAAKPVRVL